MKRKKRLVNMAMLIILFTVMAAHFTGIETHKVFGIVLILVFCYHQYLNRKWFKSLKKGNYNFFRKTQLLLNLFLIFAFIGLAASGFLLSSVASSLNIRMDSFARKLHMFSASLGFLLMSLHIGMHWDKMLHKIKRKVPIPSWIGKIVTVTLIALSIYISNYRQFFLKMFWQIDYPYHNYQESPIVFFLDYLIILSGGVAAGRFLSVTAQKVARLSSKRRRQKVKSL